MAKLMKTIHDLESGEIVEVEMTSEEIAFQTTLKNELQEAEAAKEAAKQAVLTKLGLTAEELAAALS